MNELEHKGMNVKYSVHWTGTTCMFPYLAPCANLSTVVTVYTVTIEVRSKFSSESCVD